MSPSEHSRRAMVLSISSRKPVTMSGSLTANIGLSPFGPAAQVYPRPRQPARVVGADLTLMNVGQGHPDHSGESGDISPGCEPVAAGSRGDGQYNRQPGGPGRKRVGAGS